GGGGHAGSGPRRARVRVRDPASGHDADAPRAHAVSRRRETDRQVQAARAARAPGRIPDDRGRKDLEEGPARGNLPARRHRGNEVSDIVEEIRLAYAAVGITLADPVSYGTY